jgi:hypothetical protein
MQSKAIDVQQYIDELAAPQRAAIQAVRQMIAEAIDPAYVECMQYGMISYVVPHSIYPAGYHCDPKQPLPFAGLAAQKNHNALYFMGLYSDPKLLAAFEKRWKASGKKLDMGKSCVRFKSIDDLVPEAIAKALTAQPVPVYVSLYESLRPVAKKTRVKKASGEDR